MTGKRAQIFIGLDAGGSHTGAVAVDVTGREIGRTTGPPAGVSLETIAPAAAVIAQTVTQLVEQLGVRPPVAGLCAGAAGAGRAPERDALKEEIIRHRLATSVRVTTDGEIALEAAFPGTAGIVLIAGTGSVAFGRRDDGVVRRAGGLGWQLGDEGSGYALGRAALAVAGRALDGREPRRALTDAVLAATGARDLDALVQWAKRADRTMLAALSPALFRAAAEGDPAARELVEGAGSELVALVVALLRQLGSGVTGIALAGGLLTAETPVRQAVIGGLGRVAPQLTVASSPGDAALGAARLAARS